MILKPEKVIMLSSVKILSGNTVEISHIEIHTLKYV